MAPGNSLWGNPLTMPTRSVGAGLVARALKFSSQSFDERSLHLKAALMMNVSDEI